MTTPKDGGRRVQHVKPYCCYSRLGKAKAAYPTVAAAEKAIARGHRKYGDEPMEVYECQVQPGRYHVRKQRTQKDAVS